MKRGVCEAKVGCAKPMGFLSPARDSAIFFFLFFFQREKREKREKTEKTEKTENTENTENTEKGLHLQSHSGILLLPGLQF